MEKMDEFVIDFCFAVIMTDGFQETTRLLAVQRSVSGSELNQAR
jgi:hypothetical protein